MTPSSTPSTATTTLIPPGVPERVRQARALLMRLSGGAPTPPLGELILTAGPVTAAETLLEDPAAATACGVVVEPDTRERAAADVEHARQAGLRLVVPEDPEWPRAAAIVRWQRPNKDLAALVEVAGLWVRGPAPLGSAPRVAVIGSRAASDYGRWVARDWAAALTEAGITVVTGGGHGIDTEAIRGALAAGGAPLVVAATGLERLHPPGNRDLLAAVAERGALVSPYPPDRPASAGQFREGRTMLAGFGRDASLVVEAGVRSPALATARAAHELGRPVLVVPGPVTSATSAGAHRLAREPWARLVAGVDDIHAELAGTPG